MGPSFHGMDQWGTNASLINLKQWWQPVMIILNTKALNFIKTWHKDVHICRFNQNMLRLLRPGMIMPHLCSGGKIKRRQKIPLLPLFLTVFCFCLFVYWAVYVGLSTPLTFAWHRLSPLAAFTSGAYFLHNGRRWQWICEFHTANFKGIFGGP